MAYVNFGEKTRNSEDILVDPDVFVRAKRNRYRGSQITHVAIPVMAYRYEVKSSNLQEDFIHEAVYNLADYYAKNNLGDKCVELISRDLGLSTALIDVMIKEKRLMQSVVEDDNEMERRQQTFYFIVLFDELRGEFIDRILPVDSYESMKDVCDDFSNYRVSVGDSSVYKIVKMSIPDKAENRQRALKEPSKEAVSALLSQRAIKHRALENGTVSIKYTGISSEFYLLSSIYYDKNNAKEYCGENPFGPGRASWIINDIETYISNDYINARYLKELLSEMEDSIDVDSFKSSERHDALRNECTEYVEDIYGKNEINATGDLKERLVTVLTEYSKMIHFCQNDMSDELLYRIDEAKQRYYVAVADLYEDILGYAFQKSFIEKNKRHYLECIKDLDYYIHDEICSYSAKIGFDETQIDLKARITKKQIKYTITNQHSDTDWYLMIFACLIEALFDEKHLIYELAVEYNDFFGYLRELTNLRNPSKHGSDGELRWNNHDFQQLAIYLFELFVISPINGKKLDSNHFVEHEGIEEEYQQIDNAAQNTLSDYNCLLLNLDAYNAAMALERAYVSKSKEYYSKAYNLIDELTKQLTICVVGNRNEIDRTYVNMVMKGTEFSKNDIANKTEEILAKYSFDYHFIKRRNENNFNKSRYSSKLSYGNRIYYLIMIADYKAPIFFRRLLSDNPQWLELIELVETKRGHSEDADFNDGLIMNKHKDILTLCNNLASYIAEFEEGR